MRCAAVVRCSTKFYMAAVHRPIISATKLSIIKVIYKQIYWNLCVNSVGICCAYFQYDIHAIWIEIGDKCDALLNYLVLQNYVQRERPSNCDSTGITSRWSNFQKCSRAAWPVLWKILYFRFKMMKLIREIGFFRHNKKRVRTKNCGL